MAQLKLVNERAIRQNVVRKRLIQGTLALGIVGLIGVGAYLYFRNPHTYEVVWEQSVDLSEVGNIQTFGDRVVLYDRSGASCYDGEGNQIWSAVYDIDWPTAKRAGDYLVIVDSKGRQIVIFNKESGMTGMAYTEYKITSADISENGTVVVVTEDDTSSYIEYYDEKANKIDVEFKSTIQEDGYPMDIALSPAGTELMISYVAVDSGKIDNSISFYNFDIQEQKDDYVVGLFTHYQEKETLIPEVDFMSESEAVAIGDNCISFYSLEDSINPKLLSEYDLAEEIQSAFKDENNVGLVLEGEDSAKNLIIYNHSGSEIAKITLSESYDMIFFNNGHFVTTNASTCKIYNFSGKLYYEKDFTNQLRALEPGKNERQYYALTGTQLQYIKLR